MQRWNPSESTNPNWGVDLKEEKAGGAVPDELHGDGPVVAPSEGLWRGGWLAAASRRNAVGEWSSDRPARLRANSAAVGAKQSEHKRNLDRLPAT
jgi:hypothetical protein